MRLRIRTLLILVAALAVGLGGYLEHQRRERRREQMEYEIIRAAEAGDVPRIRALLDEGADVDSVVDGRYPWTPLLHAAYKGHFNAAKLLIENGADVNHQDLDLLRPVTVAAWYRHWDIVRLLVEHGAETGKIDRDVPTPMDYAKEQGNAEMVRYLEEHAR